MHDHVKSMLSRTSLCVLCFSSPVIFRLVDACVYGLNWLLVSFLSHVNKNIIHSFIHSFINSVTTTVHKYRLITVKNV